MKLLLTDDDGTVLDGVEIARDEWDEAQAKPLAAWALITELVAGS